MSPGVSGWMVNACADPDFFVRERGGGGPSPTARKQPCFLCLFWFFLVQNFPGMRGVQLFTGGGGGGQNANFYRI